MTVGSVGPPRPTYVPSTGSQGGSSPGRASLPADFHGSTGSKGFGSDRSSGSERTVASEWRILKSGQRLSSDDVRGGKATHVSKLGSSRTLQHAHFRRHALARRELGRLGPDFAMEADGASGEGRGHHSVHHVGLVNRRHDRSLDGF